MDSISSLFWAAVFIAAILVLIIIAFVLGLVSMAIVVPAICAVVTLLAVAIVLAACAMIARHVRRMTGLPDPNGSDNDPMLDHYGDVPAVKRGGQ